MNSHEREHLTSFHLGFKAVHQQLQGSNYFPNASYTASNVATISQKVMMFHGPDSFHHQMYMALLSLHKKGVNYSPVGRG
jgi:hypothetical protein